MAFDRSLRSVDIDGRMRIELSNISKAMVSPYMGMEIPNSESLGLDPKRIYRLLRDPQELAAAVATFNNLPLLSRHVPVTAEDHQPDLVVGATGTDAVFEAPYLKNSLVIWEAVAIAGVKTGEQAELSCAYHYTADMTPGVYDGVEFDGVMRNLIGNHVALVESGRAGPDVIAADSNPFYGVTEMKLSRTAIAALAALGAVIRPKLAQDAKMPVLSPLFEGVTQKTLKAADLAPKVRALLAQDVEMTPEELGAVIAQATEGVSDDLAADTDETDEEKEKRLKAEAEAAGAKDSDTPTPDPDAPHGPKDTNMPATKTAMDAAIRVAMDAAQATFTAVRIAENEVRPFLGEVAPQQTPEAVYKLALDAAGYDTAGVDPSAFRHVFRALPKPGGAAQPRVSATLAQDAATAAGDFKTRFPTAVVPRRS